MRNTLQKDIVRNVVLGTAGHPTAEMVYERVTARYPTISRATVFRILRQMWEAGELLKVLIPDGADCFDLRLDNHYHIRCHQCGKVADLKMEYQSDIVSRIEDANGFSIEKHLILFEGVCPDCKR